MVTMFEEMENGRERYLSTILVEGLNSLVGLPTYLTPNTNTVARNHA